MPSLQPSSRRSNWANSLVSSVRWSARQSHVLVSCVKVSNFAHRQRSPLCTQPCPHRPTDPWIQTSWGTGIQRRQPTLYRLWVTGLGSDDRCKGQLVRLSDRWNFVPSWVNRHQTFQAKIHRTLHPSSSLWVSRCKLWELQFPQHPARSGPHLPARKRSVSRNTVQWGVRRHLRRVWGCHRDWAQVRCKKSRCPLPKTLSAGQGSSRCTCYEPIHSHLRRFPPKLPTAKTEAFQTSWSCQMSLLVGRVGSTCLSSCHLSFQRCRIRWGTWTNGCCLESSSRFCRCQWSCPLSAKSLHCLASFCSDSCGHL